MKIIKYLNDHYEYNLENYKKILLHILLEESVLNRTISAATYQKVMNAKNEEEIENYVNKHFIDKVSIISLKEVESPLQDWLDFHEAVNTNCRGKLAQWHGEQAEILKTTKAEEMLPKIEDVGTIKKCSCGQNFVSNNSNCVYCLNCNIRVNGWIKGY
jgi:hypothetical protein